jgi:hypothetical protein
MALVDCWRFTGWASAAAAGAATLDPIGEIESPRRTT